MSTFRRVPRRTRDDSGFTLAELLVATAILGVVLGLLAMIVVQLYQVTVQSANQLAVLRDLAQAEEILARDVNSASAALIPNENPLVLTVADAAGGPSRAVTYTLAAPLLLRDDGSGKMTTARRLVTGTAFSAGSSAGGGRLIEVRLQAAQGRADEAALLRLALRAATP